MIVKAKHTGKWVTRVEPDDSIAVAAQVTLKPRLKAVRHSLKLAATRWREDVEHVHELRVHTRRCLAAIELYRDVLPRRQRKRLQRWLIKIRKAAGEARDMDVLLAKCRQMNQDVWPITFAGEHALAVEESNAIARCCKVVSRQIKKRRRKAQRPIRKLYERLIASGRLKRCSKRLLKSIPSHERFGQLRSGQLRFEQWAQNQFGDAIERFVSATPRPGASLEEWHRFRIRGKQLRYTMELVSSAYDRDFRTELYVCVSQLQDHLGELADHSTACQYLSRFRRRFRKGSEARLLEAMIAREEQGFAETLLQFQSWWLVDAQARLTPLLQRYR